MSDNRKLLENLLRKKELLKQKAILEARGDIWKYLCYVEPEFYLSKQWGHLYIIKTKDEIIVYTTKGIKKNKFIEKKLKIEIEEIYISKPLLGRYEICRRLKREINENQEFSSVVDTFERMSFSDIDITPFIGRKSMKPVVDGFQALYDEEITKMAASCPPRYGKSVTTDFFSTFLFGNTPKGAIMRNCCTASLAKDFTKSVRNKIESHTKIKEIYPWLELDSNDKGSESWRLKDAPRTSMFGFGTSGNVIGKGCDILCSSDDLFGSFGEAQSTVVAEDKWKWYIGSHLTRAEQGCMYLDIGTRWGENCIITKQIANEYYDLTVNIVATDENNDTTCEAWMTTEELKVKKSITDEFIWQAEFMQNPISAEGLMYKNGFKTYKEIPIEVREGGKIFCNVDPKSTGIDFLCAIAYYEYKGEGYILDVMYTQDDMTLTQVSLPNFLIRNKVVECIIETNKESMFPVIMEKKMKDAGHYTTSFTPYYETRNKIQRIIEYSAHVQRDIFFPSNWKIKHPDFYTGVTTFTKNPGKKAKDDHVDCLTSVSKNIADSNKGVIIV